MFSSMAESCSTALHRPSARCLSTWVSHLLTPRHCLFCYWCFFVHCEDKLQVLGCISASFVRSQMNKTMITSMHLMHWFTNESEAIWDLRLNSPLWQVTIAWVKVVSGLWQFSWQGVTLASRVTSLCHVIFASDHALDIKNSSWQFGCIPISL